VLSPSTFAPNMAAIAFILRGHHAMGKSAAGR